MRRRQSLAILSAAVLTSLLAACATVRESAPIPPFYDRLDLTGHQVDPASSLSMINQYRGNNGARPLKWNPTLAQVARQAAERMGAAGKVLSADDVRLAETLPQSGYRYKMYTANLSAGYRTFAEAFSGWRELKENNAHLLDSRASEIGVATALVPGSKYQVFWAVVVADPM
jgi:uncharacterized protein YkwD